MRRGLGTGMAANGFQLIPLPRFWGIKENESYKQVYITDLQSLRCCTLDFDSLGGGV